MRNKLFSLLEELREKTANVNEVPNVIWYKSLFFALGRAGLDSDTAAFVAATMKLDINEDFVADEELLNATVDTYVEIIVKVKAALDKLHPQFFRWSIEAEPMALKANL